MAATISADVMRDEGDLGEAPPPQTLDSNPHTLDAPYQAPSQAPSHTTQLQSKAPAARDKDTQNAGVRGPRSTVGFQIPVKVERGTGSPCGGVAAAGGPNGARSPPITGPVHRTRSPLILSPGVELTSSRSPRDMMSINHLLSSPRSPWSPRFSSPCAKPYASNLQCFTSKCFAPSFDEPRHSSVRTRRWRHAATAHQLHSAGRVPPHGPPRPRAGAVGSAGSLTSRSLCCSM